MDTADTLSKSLPSSSAAVTTATVKSKLPNVLRLTIGRDAGGTNSDQDALLKSPAAVLTDSSSVPATAAAAAAADETNNEHLVAVPVKNHNSKVQYPRLISTPSCSGVHLSSRPVGRAESAVSSWRLPLVPFRARAIRSRRLTHSGDCSSGGCLLHRRSHLTSSAYRKSRRRALFKNGERNVALGNVSEMRRRYLQDLFTTLVDARWRWTLGVFCMSFVFSWLAFGCGWYMIAYTHGDLAPENVNGTTNWSPCVVNMHTFVASFLFSVETQHTTGYGYRMVTEECPEAIVLFCLQSVFGLMIQAFMVGIVFAKMARPKQRSQTLIFSRYAVICQRNGKLCFMFRLGDMRKKSHLIGATIRTRFIRSRVTSEGETLSPHVTYLKTTVDDFDEQVFLFWPTVAVHVIDQDSPMYALSAADLLNERFEVVVVLEGTTESTGQTTQARTSYLPSETLWGHRFRPLLRYCKTKLSYEVDYSQFDDVYKVDTPLCSVKDLETYLTSNGNGRMVT